MSNRIDSINALLERSKQDLTGIEQEYNKSLHTKKIEPSLKIDIKNLCENLRSVLDYLARDIRDKFSPPAKSGGGNILTDTFDIVVDDKQSQNQLVIKVELGKR